MNSRLSSALDNLKALPDSYVHYGWMQVGLARSIELKLLGRLPFKTEVGHLKPSSRGWRISFRP